MKKLCVIGNPIEHSLSPKIHNIWIKQNKLDFVYEKKLLEKYGDDAVINVQTGKVTNGDN